MHPDGYVELKDRSKDVIISGGENIASIEVEQALYSHPDVVESAVVAAKDPRWGEVPIAFVTLRAGATVSEQDGSSVVPPEVLARGVPFITEGDDSFLGELREAVEDALDRAAEQHVTEVDVLEQMLHDDLASFIYDRLKRRPMVLPVVVEV